MESRNSITSNVSDYEDSSSNEEMEDYKMDGYHPVVLGEYYNTGKYQILQKLGWGHFSTVWLAIDKKVHGYFALKILKSKKSYTEAAQDELEILKKLKEKDDGSKPTNVVEYIDSFYHYGLHGKHQCIVFEIMGPNLLDLIQHYEDRDEIMPIWLVKLITKQLLVGLDYTHSAAGVIHTDIKPENIMIELEEESREKFVNFITEFKKKPTSMKFLKKSQASNSAKNKAKYAKKKAKKAQARLSNSSQPEINEVEYEEDKVYTEKKLNALDIKEKEDLHEEEKEEKENFDMKILKWKNLNIPINSKLKIKIVDYGNGCWVNKHFTENIQTREYRSPEAIINAPYSTSTDIWSVGCLVFEMLTNSFLFKPKKGSTFKKNDDHLALMFETLGKIPKQFALSGSRSRDFFNKNGELIRIKALKSFPISAILEKDFKYDPDDCKEIEEFLLPMLEYEPKKRASAGELLKSEWLSNLNLPS